MTVYYDLPKPEERHDCPDCGRDEGHHLGCPAVGRTYVQPDDSFEPEGISCAAEGCQDAPKPYGGKGPRPKYCAAHGS